MKKILIIIITILCCQSCILLLEPDDYIPGRGYYPPARPKGPVKTCDIRGNCRTE